MADKLGVAGALRARVSRRATRTRQSGALHARVKAARYARFKAARKAAPENNLLFLGVLRTLSCGQRLAELVRVSVRVCLVMIYVVWILFRHAHRATLIFIVSYAYL